MIELSRLESELLSEKFQTESERDLAVKRLEAGEPFAYVIGEWYFYTETYKVSPACLIPRPETEHLVDELIKTLPKNGSFADLCTGSGCISISVLAHRPDLTAVAVDISDDALALAKENAALNGVSDRISFIRADILTCDALGNSVFDAVVANPPYIKTEVIDTLSLQVKHEPRIALDGGEDGLLFYRTLFDKYRLNVKDGGMIICEIGYDQGEDLKRLFSCDIRKDYSGNDRIALMRVQIKQNTGYFIQKM